MKSNTYRAIFFEKPDIIPMVFAINPACWHHYPQEWFAEQILNHPLLFPCYQAPELPYEPQYSPDSIAGQPFRDDMGCVWKTTDDGIRGVVVEHPLANLNAVRDFRFPDPEVSDGFGKRDWKADRRHIESAHAAGDIAICGLRHGHTFLQLSDLCGYQNLLCAMADDEPMLRELIERLEEFNHFQIRRYVEYGADLVSFPEDLGMQTGPMLSPGHFREYIKPSYTRMMKTVRDKGLPVHMHSDGDIRTLADDLVDSGVAALNLQDLVNSIDWIKAKYRGKLCIDLDIDRQKVTVFGTPRDIGELIRSEVEALACPDGGLMMTFGLYPGTPMENVTAIMDAMERYMQWY